MGQAVQCPGCKKKFPLTPALAGKRVKCTECGTVFSIPAVRSAAQRPAQAAPAAPRPAAPRTGLDDLFAEEFGSTAVRSAAQRPAQAAPAAPRPAAPRTGLDDLFAEEFGSTAAGGATPPGLPAAAQAPSPGPGPLGAGPLAAGAPLGEGAYLPRKQKKFQLDENDAALLKFGIGMGVFGCLAMILPLFGLQFKVLNFPGGHEAIPFIALGIAGLGAAVVFYAMRQQAALGAAGFAGVIAAAFVVFFISSAIQSDGGDAPDAMPVARGEPAARRASSQPVLPGSRSGSRAPLPSSAPGPRAGGSSSGGLSPAGQEADGLFKRLFAEIKEGTDLLRSIRGERTARAKVSHMQSLVQRINATERKILGMRSRLTREDAELLKQRYKGQYTSTINAYVGELGRVARLGGQSSVPSPPSFEQRFGLAAAARGSGAAPGPASPRGPDQCAAKLREKHGAGNVVSIEIQGIPEGLAAVVHKRLGEASGCNESYFGTSENQQWFAGAPVAGDLNALAARIDFAASTEVDAERRKITVVADLDKLPTPPGREVTDPSDPEFYKANLADLGCVDPHRRRKAVERLTEAEPKELRKEIAEALKKNVREGEHFERIKGIEALAHWAGAAAVPDLIELVDDKDTFVAAEAIKALGEFPEPRVAEALVDRLGHHHQAEHALRNLGPAAEDALLAVLDPNDRKRTPLACEILGEVGTRKSLEKLKEMARSENFFVRVSADKAVHQVARRPAASSVATPAKPSAEPGGKPEARPSAKPAAGDPISIALLDLELSEGRARGAADRLAKMSVDEGRRAEVSAALVKVLGSAQDHWTTVACVKALGAWHTPEAVPAMIRCLDHESHGVRWPAFEALAKVQDERAAEAVAARLAEGGDRGHAAKALAEMGPVAEGAVLPYVSHADPSVRTEAIKTLGRIGTKRRSLPPLSRLIRDKNFFVKNAAQEAVRAINARRDPPRRAEDDHGG